jgi:hypothetical protein
MLSQTFGTLSYHGRSFDGLTSAVLAADYLEGQEQWKIDRFIPVDYTVKKRWLNAPLPKNSAVVDFLFHPAARFWVDHHRTTVVTDDAEISYEIGRSDPKRFFLYDRTAPAAARVLWDAIADRMSEPDRYAEMARWATLIDSANYENAHQAVYGELALRITQTLRHLHQNPLGNGRLASRSTTGACWPQKRSSGHAKSRPNSTSVSASIHSAPPTGYDARR